MKPQRSTCRSTRPAGGKQHEYSGDRRQRQDRREARLQSPPRGQQHRRGLSSFGVDTVTGVGLAKAASDAKIVIDVSDSPSSDGEEALAFFEKSGLNLMAAGHAAGVRHHIALSIVGLERLLSGDYFRAKKLQEDLIRESGLPYTILRSTQFFELISDLAQKSSGSDVAIPPVLVQPISSDDLADALTEIALGRPQNRIVEVAGPESRRTHSLGARRLRGSVTCRSRQPRALLRR
jgi:hypothetical protein